MHRIYRDLLFEKSTYKLSLKLLNRKISDTMNFERACGDVLQNQVVVKASIEETIHMRYLYDSGAKNLKILGSN